MDAPVITINGQTIDISKLFDQDAYAKGGSVKLYSSDLSTVLSTAPSGAYLGNIYSYVTKNDGTLFFMIYRNQSDYDNFIATYLPVTSGNVYIPNLLGIVKQEQTAANAAKEAAEKAQKGVVGYYIEKYAPVIIAGGLAVMALPTILNFISPKKGISNGSEKII